MGHRLLGSPWARGPPQVLSPCTPPWSSTFACSTHPTRHIPAARLRDSGVCSSGSTYLYFFVRCEGLQNTEVLNAAETAIISLFKLALKGNVPPTQPSSFPFKPTLPLQYLLTDGLKLQQIARLQSELSALRYVKFLPTP